MIRKSRNRSSQSIMLKQTTLSTADDRRDRGAPQPALGANMAETRDNSIPLTEVAENPRKFVDLRPAFRALDSTPDVNRCEAAAAAASAVPEDPRG